MHFVCRLGAQPPSTITTQQNSKLKIAKDSKTEVRSCNFSVMRAGNFWTKAKYKHW